MYEHFYGFAERPFDLTPNPRYLVLTHSHREALSNLEYAIASRKGVTLLTGDAGSGKTTLLRAAIEKQPETVHFVTVHNPTLTRNEFAEMLASHFHLSEKAQLSKTAMLIELEALLRERHGRGEATVLVVDEAQSLPHELLEEIRLLANIETNAEKLLCVILAGQPELGDRLEDPTIRQLKQRVALRCELRPLNQNETAAYLAGRIRAAGGVGAQVFTREAVGLIHHHSRGIPRTISVIADNALLGGFATAQRPVTSALVREVCKDFRIDAGPLAQSFRSEEPGPDAPAPMSAGHARKQEGPAAPGHGRKSEAAPAAGRLLGIDRTEFPSLDREPSNDSADSAERDERMFANAQPRRRRFLFFGERDSAK
jgi:general secretion pathway protein A